MTLFLFCTLLLGITLTGSKCEIIVLLSRRNYIENELREYINTVRDYTTGSNGTTNSTNSNSTAVDTMNAHIVQ